MPPNETLSDEGILGESTYEFIDTDTESRDDAATESVASTDLGRPDDVASLADTERSGEESEDEEDIAGSNSIPALPALEQTVERAFDTPTIGRSSHVLVDEVDKPLLESIEFEEPFSLGAETVSVKHTVADLNEEQTLDVLKAMSLSSSPERLVVTIRQTMTKQGLSTKDPLHILYVGSHSAKQDIIHKIASSVTASVECGQRAQQLRHAASQIYNVVPVSAFGSERTPEIELMHSSGYQIKVEDCLYAQSLRFEDRPEKPDVIKLSLEDSFAYHSVPEKGGFIIEPQWELPHIAVFYCSENDDAEARRTRNLARKFMSRHTVPSIVIAHKNLFDKAPHMTLDQHSIHMCLESRDGSGRGNIIHSRVPIDLSSFLNIDARQMNRNLAYLTGLHDSSKASKAAGSSRRLQVEDVELVDHKNCSFSMTNVIKHIIKERPFSWRSLLSIGMLCLSIFVGAYTGIQGIGQSKAPAILLNSKVMSAVSISSTSLFSLTSTVMSATSAPTPVAASTSTRTITVTQSLVPGPNSLSVVPSMELGTVPKVPQAKPSNKSSVCTAVILGDREILIRIPSATKLTWLNREAISVNVTRNNSTVETERAYSANEGIVLRLPEKEAYGVVNVSIITSKKPRVNETFQLDFGPESSYAWLFLRNTLDSIFASTQISKKSETETTVAVALNKSQSALLQLPEFLKSTLGTAATVTSNMTQIAKIWSLEAVKCSAIISKEVGIRAAEAKSALRDHLESFELRKIRKQADEGVLAAQIRSKIMWLRMQGKEKEAEDYKRRAVELMQQRIEAQKETRESSSQQTVEKNPKLTKRAARKEARKTKKGARKSKGAV